MGIQAEKFRLRELHVAATILKIPLDSGIRAVAASICAEFKVPIVLGRKKQKTLIKQYNAKHADLAKAANKQILAKRKYRNAHLTKPVEPAKIGPLQPIGKPHEDYKRDPDFYGTRQWKELRYMALKNNGARCQCCGASAADGEVMHVDHIEPIYKRPDLKLDLDNLQILCSSCNLGKGAWDNTDWRQHMKSI